MGEIIFIWVDRRHMGETICIWARTLGEIFFVGFKCGVRWGAALNRRSPFNAPSRTVLLAP